MSIRITGSSEAQWRIERKALSKELKESQSLNEELRGKLSRTKERLSQTKTRELSLMQTNRILLDVVKSYAERESTVLAGWKTLTLAFGKKEQTDQ